MIWKLRSTRRIGARPIEGSSISSSFGFGHERAAIATHLLLAAGERSRKLRALPVQERNSLYTRSKSVFVPPPLRYAPIWRFEHGHRREQPLGSRERSPCPDGSGSWSSDASRPPSKRTDRCWITMPRIVFNAVDFDALPLGRQTSSPAFTRRLSSSEDVDRAVEGVDGVARAAPSLLVDAAVVPRYASMTLDRSPPLEGAFGDLHAVVECDDAIGDALDHVQTCSMTRIVPCLAEARDQLRHLVGSTGFIPAAGSSSSSRRAVAVARARSRGGAGSHRRASKPAGSSGSPSAAGRRTTAALPRAFDSSPHGASPACGASSAVARPACAS